MVSAIAIPGGHGAHAAHHGGGGGLDVDGVEHGEPGVPHAHLRAIRALGVLAALCCWVGMLHGELAAQRAESAALRRALLGLAAGVGGEDGAPLAAARSLLSVTTNSSSLMHSEDPSDGGKTAFSLRSDTGPMVLGAGGSDAVHIDTAGSVGLGVDSPKAKLDVDGGKTATEPALLLRQGDDKDGNSGGFQVAFGYDGTDQFKHVVGTRHCSDCADAARNAIDLFLWDVTTDAPRWDEMGTKHGLSVTAGGVGILGVKEPSAALDVGGGKTATEPALLLRQGDDKDGNSGGFQVAFGYDGTDQFKHVVGTRHCSDCADAARNAIDLFLWDVTTDAPRWDEMGTKHGLSVTAGGVGILGVKEPSAALDVGGDAKLSGKLTVGTGGVVFSDGTSLTSTPSFTEEGNIGSCTSGTGATSGGSDWNAEGSAGLYIDVDTSSASFDANGNTPRYVAQIGCWSQCWATTTAVYSPTATGFRAYVYFVTGGLSSSTASSNGWYITWIGTQC